MNDVLVRSRTGTARPRGRLSAAASRRARHAAALLVAAALSAAPGVTASAAQAASGAAVSVAVTDSDGVTAAGMRPAPGSTRTSPPTGVTATAGDTTATVTWSRPVDDGGTPVLHYSVTNLATGAVVRVRGTTYTARKLANGIPVRFAVRAHNGNGASAPAESAAVTPMARLAVDPASATTVPEGAGAVVQSLVLTDHALSDVRVHVHTGTEGSAQPGVDFEPVDTVVTIPAGQRSASFTVPLIDDDAQESTEQIAVHLDVEGAVLGPVPGRPLDFAGYLLSVTDDDDPAARPKLSVTGPARVTEGNEGWTDVTYRVELRSPTPKDTVLRYQAVLPPHARGATSWIDVDRLPHSVALAAGARTAEVTVQVRGDRSVERDLVFSFQVRVPGYGEASTSTTVVDDDGDVPQPGADLVLAAEETGPVGSVPVGTVLPWTIRVRNRGPQTATDVTVTLRVKASGVKKTQIGSEDVVCGPASAPKEASYRLYSCLVGIMPAGSEAVLRLRATAARQGSWDWTGWVDSAEGTDPHHEDNADGGSVTITPVADADSAAVTPAAPTITDPATNPDADPDAVPLSAAGPTELRSVPSAPTDVRVEPHNGALVVSWVPSAVANPRVLRYKVRDLVTGEVRGLRPTTPDRDGRINVLIFRPNGSQVAFDVSAVNAIGWSRPSEPSAVASAQPEIWQVGGGSVRESAGAPAQVIVQLPVTGAGPLPASVRVRTTGGGTATPGVDFVPLDTVVSIPPHAGSTLLRVPIDVIDDDTPEQTETIGVVVSDAAGIGLRDSGRVSEALAGEVSIVDDDGDEPVVTLTADQSEVTEGDAGSTPARFTARLSRALPSALRLTYRAGLPGDVASVEFDSAPHEVVIPAGTTSAQFAIDVLGDTAVESDLVVPVSVQAPDGVSVAGPASVLVRDDDSNPARGQELRVRVSTPVAAENVVTSLVRVRALPGGAGSAPVDVVVALAKAAQLEQVRVLDPDGAACLPVATVEADAWARWTCRLSPLAPDDDVPVRVSGRLSAPAQVDVVASVRSDPFSDVDHTDNVGSARARLR